MKRLFVALIIFSGIFYYRVPDQRGFDPAQFSFFVFSAGMLGSWMLYKSNRYLGLLAGLFAVSFLKTYLLGQGEYLYLYKEALIGFSIFSVYYAVRVLDIKEDILKWFLIPIGLNILLVFIQKFDGGIDFVPVRNMTGFLGNISVTSTYLALGMPICLYYFPKFAPFLLITSAICCSRVPFTAMVISALVYLWYTNKAMFKRYAIITFVGITLFFSYFGIFNRGYFKDWSYWFKERGSFIVGTLDGVMHNPIAGWGIGSFEPVMKRIPEEESYYCGAAFNARRDYDERAPNPGIYMNHPHNEYIYGWWNVGILFPILLLGLLLDISRKFTRKSVLPFSILTGGMVLGMGYFFAYPVWFFLIVTLGIYDNQQGGLLWQRLKRRK
ncbi:MAG: hypothetical protein ABIA66_01200 [Candidatus Omnitrophota bacterium]